MSQSVSWAPPWETSVLGDWYFDNFESGSGRKDSVGSFLKMVMRISSHFSLLIQTTWVGLKCIFGKSFQLWSWSCQEEGRIHSFSWWTWPPASGLHLSWVWLVAVNPYWFPSLLLDWKKPSYNPSSWLGVCPLMSKFQECPADHWRSRKEAFLNSVLGMVRWAGLPLCWHCCWSCLYSTWAADNIDGMRQNTMVSVSLESASSNSKEVVFLTWSWLDCHNTYDWGPLWPSFVVSWLRSKSTINSFII